MLTKLWFQSFLSKFCNISITVRQKIDFWKHVKFFLGHPKNHFKSIQIIPRSIEKRISETSSIVDIFNRSIRIYNDALHESNFKETLQFVIPAPKNNNENQKRKRKQNITWFNPLYSKHFKTNIRKTFLQLLSNHFPKDHQMHEIFNKNIVKFSYSCMNNISSTLSTHNKSILNPKQISFGWNCRSKDNCPLDGECLTPNIIYRADVTTDNDQKLYYGTSETTFKQRHSNHTCDFKHVKYQHAIELAKYMWQLKTIISITVLSGRLLQKYMVILKWKNIGQLNITIQTY